MQAITEKLEKLEKRIQFQQGLIEIISGFIESKFGKKEFIKHLKVVAESEQFSKETKSIARSQLQQEALWVKELDGKQKH